MFNMFNAFILSIVSELSLIKIKAIVHVAFIDKIFLETRYCTLIRKITTQK